MPQSTLQVKNLCVQYGNIKAVRNINFEFKSGEITTLIGSNGAGKTSTLKAVMGLLPSTGEILLGGKNLNTMSVSDRLKEKITLCPEGRGIFPNLTVFDNLMIGAYQNKSHKQILNLIEQQFTFLIITNLHEMFAQDSAKRDALLQLLFEVENVDLEIFLFD